MNKKMKVFTSLSIISATLLLGYYSTAFSSSNFSERETAVQKSVINTFDLNTEGYKLLSTKDIYNQDSTAESSEVRLKIASAIEMLAQSNELKIGDFKPMTFLKGNKLLIGIKHPDKTITLTEFDISKEKPVIVNKSVKEGKK